MYTGTKMATERVQRAGRRQKVPWTTPGGGPPAKADVLSSESIRRHALNTFGSTLKVSHWMSRPNHLLQGKTPEEALKTDPESVEAALIRIDFGVYV